MAEIKGYPEFMAALNKIEAGLPKEMKDAAQQVAHDWIAAAQNKAGPHAKGPAAAFTVVSNDEGVTLVNDHPLFYGEEFGGQARPSTMQFPPHMGQRGYWFFPAARENADKFQKVWEAAIDTATKSWDHKE